MDHSELIEACKQNDLGRVRELLDRGADPNLQNEHGQTALWWASYWGNIDVVRLLLDYGTDPNLQASGGWTALMYGWTALMYASRLGHTGIVRLLLDHGADPNLQTFEYGWTAMIYASREGQTDVVKLLDAFSGWNRNVAQPLEDLDIFPEGLIREHLMAPVL
jgi:ankyrin repeat protein